MQRRPRLALVAGAYDGRVEAGAAREDVVPAIAHADQHAAEPVGQQHHDQQPADGQGRLAGDAERDQAGESDDEEGAEERAADAVRARRPR